eukprot:s470_g14.t1
MSISCEACPAGTFALEGSYTCQRCESGHVSGSGSATCWTCEHLLIHSRPDDLKQTCQIAVADVFLALISSITSSCFCFLLLLGFWGTFQIADVSAQGSKLVITTSMWHFLLKWKRARPQTVTFVATGVPELEKQEHTWTVKALNIGQLVLESSQEIATPVDTSMGLVRMKFPHPFLSTGMWHCPLICWCLLFFAATIACVSQLKWSLCLVVGVLGICVGSSHFCLRRRLGSQTPLAKRRRRFLKEWPLIQTPCSRGPDRAIKAGQLHDFFEFFDVFIKERPAGEEWRESAYWVCTFSNSQWHIEEELGNGNVEQSSFYLALRSRECMGTAMIIDEHVLPLTRKWCIFELYQTIHLSQSADFRGLLLCTSTGVLQEGKAGTDIAVAVARTAKEIDTRKAEATSEKDEKMIHSLIENMPGGFDAMNRFVQKTIGSALEASHLHFEKTYEDLRRDLANGTNGSSGSSGSSSSGSSSLWWLLGWLGSTGFPVSRRAVKR